MRKIREMGLGGKLLQLINQFLSNRTQHVVNELASSEKIKCSLLCATMYSGRSIAFNHV